MDLPLSHDLRASSTTKNRLRARSEKYYNFRGVKPGQIHQPHYRLYPLNQSVDLRPDLLLSQSTFENSTSIEHLTPRILYEEAQRWPRPPRYHHRHKDKLDKRGATNAYENRVMKQRDEGRMVRESLGPRDTWEDDEIWFVPRYDQTVCRICLPWNSECIRKKYFDGLEDKIKEGWALHQEYRAEVLMDEAERRWEKGQREPSDMDEWSIWSDSDEGPTYRSEDSDSEATWMIVNPWPSITMATTNSDP